MTCFTDPVQWNDQQVLLWLNWAIGEFSLEGVQVSNFNMTGRQLVEYGRESFLQRAPPFMGDILWEHLEILLKGISFMYSYTDFSLE